MGDKNILYSFMTQDNIDCRNIMHQKCIRGYRDLVPENGGFGWETSYKEISWPVSRPAGEYVEIAESPLVSETETSRFFYTAMERNVPIFKNKTNELTLTLKLKEFPKD